MTEKRLRYLKRSFYIAGSLPVIFIVSLIMRRPDRVSDRLLRFGGGIINAATDNIDRVALFTGICVLVLWIGIAAVAYIEKRTASKQPTE